MLIGAMLESNAKPGARELVDRPQRAIVDRPQGRAIAADIAHARGRQRRPAGGEILREAFRRQLVHALVQVSVRSDFVSRLDDLVDERGISLGDPAKDEERAADAACVQQVRACPCVVSTTRLGRASQ